jgi:hypothetical protein
MTITKTEVERALYHAESCLHRHPLSNDLVEITESTLYTLLEAAKCAKYRRLVGSIDGDSGATNILDDGSSVITGRHA